MEKNVTTDAVDLTEAVFPLPTEAEPADIYVEPIPDISDDFIRGMDASAVLAEENSGVKYYNYDGEEQDVFMTLAQSGVNYIRLRVWNDPYDENGNGYGGGNNDVETAIEHQITIPVVSLDWLHQVIQINPELNGLLFHIKVDTGMNRIGLKNASDVKKAISSILEHNGIVEGINNVVKQIKHAACGYKKFNHLKARVMLIKGLLNPITT